MGSARGLLLLAALVASCTLASAARSRTEVEPLARRLGGPGARERRPDLALVAGDPHGGHSHGHAEKEHGGHGHAEHGADDHGHAGKDLEGYGHADYNEPDHGHSDHGHADHGHGDSHISGEGAHSVAVGLIATVVIVPLVMFMAMSDWLIATLTFKMLDTFVSIFLAVLWFNTFSQFLDTFDLRFAFPLATSFFSIGQCLVLYVIALAIGYLWRNETLALTTFCSVGAHFIAFAGIMAMGHTQKHASKVAPHDFEPVASFVFCFFLVGMLIAVSAVSFFAWRRNVKHHEFDHAIEHLELDIAGLVLSFCITQAVQHAIAGHFPSAHHLLLAQEAAAEEQLGGPKHPAWHCYFMLGWSLMLTLVAGLTMPKLSELAKRGVWAARGVHVTKVVLIMLVAWGYLLWGQWEFNERMFHGDAMFGHMLFACIATLVCLAVLYVLALVQGKVTNPQARETNDITITGISLVAAWSWEHCFNIALDVIGHEYQVGYKGLVPKLILAVVIPAVLLPTYVRHIRTRVIEMEKHQHEEGDEHGADGQEGTHNGQEATNEGEAHGQEGTGAGEAAPAAAR